MLKEIKGLRWIAYIKLLNHEFKHIIKKDNCIANMLSRASYDNEEDMINDKENIEINYFTNSMSKKERLPFEILLQLFCKELYDGERLHIRKYLKILKRHKN
jgi:hypothetical protein